MKSVSSSTLMELFSGVFTGQCPPALPGGCSSKEWSAHHSHTAWETPRASPAETQGTGQAQQAAVPKPLTSSQHLHCLLSQRAGAPRQCTTAIKQLPSKCHCSRSSLHCITQPALSQWAAKDFSLSVSSHCAIRCKMCWLGFILWDRERREMKKLGKNNQPQLGSDYSFTGLGINYSYYTLQSTILLNDSTLRWQKACWCA